MSKFYFSLIVALFSLNGTAVYAKIWRVNNNTGIIADFTTLQAAHNGAAAGDTLHLEGSPNSYGSLSCSKKLAIFGPGYFLDENLNLQALTISAKVNTIDFNAGSGGSVLMGLDFQGSYNVNINAPDITLRRCKFIGALGATPDYYIGVVNIAANNILIAENYGLMINISGVRTGILIMNNFITRSAGEGENTTSNSLYSDPNIALLVQNNIFRRGRITVSNSNLMNNIMVAGLLTGTGNLISNNIGNSTQFGTTNGNQSNINMSAVFVGTGTGVSSDGQWKLKAGSPAIGAGYGSTPGNPVDAGIYGGTSPYKLSGLPPAPAVYFFQNQPVGSSNDPIDVTVKVRSNN